MGTYDGVTLGVPGVAWDGDTAVRFQGSTTNRLTLNPVGAFPTTAFTFEVFIRSNDDNGGLVSYATEAEDNTIYIDDPDGLDTFVSGNELSTQVDFADNEWHHLAVSWRNSDGRLRMYVDGVMIVENTGLSTDAMLGAGGSLFIGQDQDSVGGDLETDQALDGDLDELIMYDQELDPARIEIHRRAILCE